jgi:Fe-S cluster assembly protein SufD
MTANLDHFISEYETARQLRSRRDPDRLAGLREAAFQRFLSVGFPSTRDEEWRFTSVAPIAERAFTLGAARSSEAPGVDVDRWRLPGPLAAELVFIDGRYLPALSTMNGAGRARIGSLAAALADDAPVPLATAASIDKHPFVALNTAFAADGAYIDVPAHAVVEQPIHVIFISTAAPGWTMAHPRVLAVLGENSQASIVETYGGAAGARYFTNVVTELVLGENAVLDHYKLQHENAEAYHVGVVCAQARRKANVASHSISLGGSLVRNDVVAVLDGEGIDCALNGLYLADHQRLVDNHTTIDHARPHCGSRELYKGVLADRARAVFNGKIIVRPEAQKTDAKQTSRALLLSEDAQINTKPQLEIFANDVRCTHGAAVGQLEDEAMFYLRSRGLSEADARLLLVRAFVGEVVNRLPLERIRVGVERALDRQLERSVVAAA